MNALQMFLDAADASDDVRAEALIPQLCAEDEAKLLSASRAPNVDRRWWAIRALATIGGETAISQVATALQDDDASARAVAAMALAELYQRMPAPVQPQLAQLVARLGDDNGTVRQAAVDSLARCGDAAVPLLADVLRGENDAARTRAAMTLRRIASMPAAAVLYRCLNDQNYLVHTYAYEALDEMGLLETVLVTV